MSLQQYLPNITNDSEHIFNIYQSAGKGTPHVVRSIFNSNEFVQEWDQ